MATETELKLAMTPTQLQRLRRHPVIRSLAQGRSRAHRLINIYFDTPDFRLREHRVMLRIREVDGRRIQTIKAPGALVYSDRQINGGAGIAQEFEEFEHDLSADAGPELDDFDAPGLAQIFADPDLRNGLSPVFHSEIERRTLPLALADSLIELALDQGTIRAAGRELAVCEAELELQSGRRSRLYELALMLIDQIPFHLEGQSKSARGFALYDPATPEAVSSSPSALDPSMTVAEAFETLAGECLQHVRANEAAVLQTEEPEGVHQFRVALRRMRALVSLFKDVIADDVLAVMKEELRWLQQQFGPARDWDVFRLETVDPLCRRLPSEESLKDLAGATDTMRTRGYEQARATVADPRYTRLWLRLALWLDGRYWRRVPGVGEADLTAVPIREHASGLLAHRARKLRKLGRQADDMADHELHQVRIAAKKLRYAVEFFQPLFPKKAVKTYTNRLKALQDTLGSLNDAVVGYRLVDTLEHDKATAAALKPFTAGVVVGWYTARIDRDLALFQDRWKEFKKTDPFWKDG